MAYITTDGIPALTFSLTDVICSMLKFTSHRLSIRRQNDLRYLPQNLLDDIGATPAHTGRGGWGVLYG